MRPKTHIIKIGIPLIKFLFIIALNIGIIPSVLAQKKLKKADNLYSMGIYQEALENYILYEQTLTDSLLKHPVLIKIASCYSKMNNAIKASFYYSKVVIIRDNLSEEQRLNYVSALIETGQYSMAKNYMASNNQSTMYETVLTSICDYALSNTSQNTYMEINPITPNNKSEIFGMAIHNNQLLYLISDNKSKKDITLGMLFDIHSYSTSEYKFDNKEIDNSLYYTPFFDTINDIIYISKNFSESQNYSKQNIGNTQIKLEDNNNLGIFAITLNENNSKTATELLPFSYLDYNSTHPSISPDGLTLYFSSDLPSGYGGYDIYFSNKTDEGWSRPENMGSKVNTIMDDGYPFFFDGDLYFSSNGHPGYGGLDIYRYNSLTNKVENLGKPINSSYDDFYYLQLQTGKGFLISNRNQENGKDVIYIFTE